MLNKPSYVADFETITRDGQEVVWLFDLCNIVNNAHHTGYSMHDFIEFINSLNHASAIYFHNLKFDGSFIVDYLIKNGYEFCNVETKKLKKFQFNVLVTEFGAFFKLTYRNKKGRFIEIYDSLKLLPLSVKKLAKDFNLPILKGEIDYNKPRPHGYRPSSKELEYVHHDTEIVARCLQIFLNEGYDKMTISSCAFSDYKKIIGQDKYKNWFGAWSRACNIELDLEIRKSYRGGFCQCNNDYISQTIKQPVWYNDVNSLYPYIMNTAYLPYGEPVKFSGEYQQDDDYPYYVQKILVDMSVKENGIPCILNKCKGIDCNYIIDTDCDDKVGGLVELTLTNFDLELLYKNYYVYEIKFLGGYKFKVRNDMFTDYVTKYYEMKKHATIEGNGAKRCIAKLFLNSLYGKFGQNPIRAKKLPYVDIDGKVKYYRTKKEVAKRFNYLPVAVFITSLARYKVLSDILTLGKDNWIYTDTDSILSLKPLDASIIDNEELGKYKVEQIFTKARVLGPKTYWGINTRKEITAKACGCNKKALKNFPIGKFMYGNIVKSGRTCLLTVNGGKKINFGEFTFRDNTTKYQIIKNGDERKCIIKDKQTHISTRNSIPVDVNIITTKWK